MMNYNDVLNKMSSSITSLQRNKEEIRNKTITKVSTPKIDTTSNILNKIGLEIQRQGGY